MVLSLTRVAKSFGGSSVLKGIDLAVREGEFVSLLGPSGCGKTTTLNIVAGFLIPDAGDVHIAGQCVNQVPVHRRDLGMVFQGHALFPHMTCFDNVAFGLRMRKLDSKAIRKRVGEALELVHLSGYEDRFPRELSGGQQQRVGLARALAVQPRILLLDEPLSALDAKLRRAMQAELRSIHRQVRTTMVYVTHDQEEALTLSDRVAVMNAGQIEQVDAPEAIYGRPRTRFVADFIGSSSFLDGVIAEARTGAVRVEIDGVGTVVVESDTLPPAGGIAHLAVRADRVRLAVADSPAAGQIIGTITDRAFAGDHVQVVVELANGRRVAAHLSNDAPAAFAPGVRVQIQVVPSDWLLLQ